MGYTSKDILDDIHKAEPLPSKGKMTKIVKKENANKSLFYLWINQDCL